MSIDFVTAGKKIIRSEKIGTVSIPLADGRSIELLDTSLVLKCDSNLISLVSYVKQVLRSMITQAT